MSEILIPRGMLGALVAGDERPRLSLAHPMQLGESWYLAMTDGFRLYFSLATDERVKENLFDFAPHHVKHLDWLPCSPVERDPAKPHPFLQSMQKDLLSPLWEARQNATFTVPNWYTDVKAKKAKRMSRQIYYNLTAVLQVQDHEHDSSRHYEIAGYLPIESALATAYPVGFSARLLLESLRYVRRHGSAYLNHSINLVSLLKDERKFQNGRGHCLMIGHVEEGLLTHGAVLMGVNIDSWKPLGSLVVPGRDGAP